MSVSKAKRRPMVKVLLSFAKNPVVKVTLRDYLNTDAKAGEGQMRWYGDGYAINWKDDEFTVKKTVTLAYGPLRKWPSARKRVAAREVFRVAKAKHLYSGNERFTLLLRSVETLSGRVVQSSTVVGYYNYAPNLGTLCGVAKAYQGRGLGRLLLLTAHHLNGKVEVADSLTKAGYANRVSAHRLAVEQTLKAKGRVAKKVLADYPDLVRRYAKGDLAKKRA